MSLADELLNNLTDEEIAVYTTEDAEQNHIVIGADRFITVPSELKRIAVQHDENVEVVTFDCPRYWKNLDMSKMKIYINYMLPSGKLGCYCANNVVIDELDTNIMHFDWNITSNATPEKGTLSFLVCIKKKDAGGKTKNHWNSELNREMYVSAGLECEEAIIAQYPDIITQILEQIDGEVIIANNPAVDKSLTIEGFAADAKATGRAISVERARIDALQAIPEGSTSADAALYDINIGYDGTDWKAPGAAVRGQAAQLANYIDNKTSQLSDEIDYLNSGNHIKKINLEPDLIGWVHNNGTFMSDEEFYTSKPFEIQKGQTIKLVASGFRDNVSMISFYEGKNLSGTNVYTPLVISDGMLAKEYTYKAEMDMRIVVSYRIADTHSCEIVSNIKQLSSLLEQSNIVKNVDLEANFDIAYIHNNGDYIDSTRLTEYNTLHPFEIKKGQTIVLVGGGFDKNVSMISKYNGDNSYTPLVISDCNGWEVKEYIYTAEETMDIVVSYNNSYYRKCYIITDIDKIAESLDSSESTGNYIPMFHRIGGIGDSLMSGAVTGELNGNCEDRYEYSWLSCICRKNGLTANHYSMGGLTTKTWFDWRKDQLIADAGKNSLFYIALGTNDVYQNYEFGSATDEAGTDTFCGKYKEIIELVHEKNPHAPIFCVSTYGITYNFGTCANYIREISEQYNYCYYVDLLNNLPTELLRNAAINSVMQQNGHYTGYGYIQIANIIEKLSNEIIQNRMNDFIYLPFYNE